MLLLPPNPQLILLLVLVRLLLGGPKLLLLVKLFMWRRLPGLVEQLVQSSKLLFTAHLGPRFGSGLRARRLGGVQESGRSLLLAPVVVGVGTMLTRTGRATLLISSFPPCRC